MTDYKNGSSTQKIRYTIGLTIIISCKVNSNGYQAALPGNIRDAMLLAADMAGRCVGRNALFSCVLVAFVGALFFFSLADASARHVESHRLLQLATWTVSLLPQDIARHL